jgi:hypothetical protein
MFGVLKSGIKLGIGCFVTIVLIVALVAGAIWYYWGRPKPSERQRNGRRSAIYNIYPGAPAPLTTLEAGARAYFLGLAAAAPDRVAR